ncbi:hypothetical protein M702_02535 [Neisseria gonorrhoeae SK28355]|nr:hypothetical protein M702_02535 [Neisseria gonorrhoeae SK28355]KLR97980.1 hypothetical protein M683_11250 [Neisseria gonorrhoeae SK14515]KLS04112.1 hypothetical protein M686_10145 [Neisseria gonorrhoeae SK16942]KLS16879.1 hypothetical protein M687_07910 [Neisseria gonorrhoeae SK17973]KLS17605.1 hypothetical protein M704_11155 [Neisseria gonorrhoeae SK29471]KLS98922.1 hypothetical protein M681_10930 [Neisseria gonorrhoeae SK12684]
MPYLEMMEKHCKIQVKKSRVYLRLRTITISNTFGRVFFINIFELNLKKLVQRCQSEAVLTVIFFIKAKIPRDNSLYWDRLSIKGLGIS